MAERGSIATSPRGDGFQVVEITAQLAQGLMGLGADGKRKRRVLLNSADAPAGAQVWVGGSVDMGTGRRYRVLPTANLELVLEPEEELWFQAANVVGLVLIGLRVEILPEERR